MKSTFFIVADRGHFKAFRAAKPNNGRPAHLQLVTAFDLVDGHTKLTEKLEDNAGRFPVGAGPASGSGGGNGRHQNSVSEKHYEIEYSRRLARELAGRIGTVLREQKPAAWSFAAPGPVKNAVLEELDAADRKTLAESVSADLVNLDAAEVAGHFASLHPV
jgi:hypothetical protein